MNPKAFRLAAISLLAVSLVLVSPGGAQIKGNRDDGASTSALMESFTLEQLRDFMTEEGYTATIEGEVLQWKLEGFRTQVLLAKSGTGLLFHSAFSDGNATLAKVNEWNKTKRYSRSYMDDEGDPHLELDIDLEGGVSRARVVSFFKTCRSSFTVWLDEVVK